MIFYKNRFDIEKGISEVTGSLGFLKFIIILRSVGAEATLGVFFGTFGWIIGGVLNFRYFALSLKNFLFCKRKT